MTATTITAEVGAALEHLGTKLADVQTITDRLHVDGRQDAALLLGMLHTTVNSLDNALVKPALFNQARTMHHEDLAVLAALLNAVLARLVTV
jgi:hypothetical protein